jgi:protein SCO1
MKFNHCPFGFSGSLAAFTLALLVFFLPGEGLIRAQEGLAHCHIADSGASPDKGSAQVAPAAIPDLTVLTQEGKKLKFYSDLVKDRVVAINFIFTTCTTICPPMGATFGKLQALLADQPSESSDVHLISVSLDPLTDTPDRLKAWAKKFGARPGWSLATGNKQDIDQILRALGAYTAQKEAHAPLVLIGNPDRGPWTRAYGLATADQLNEAIRKYQKEHPEAALRGELQ